VTLTDQRTLFDASPEFIVPTLPGEPTLEERFQAFHTANPWVFRALVRLARQWITETGRTHVGIATLFERLRWEWDAATTDESGYKLNNSYRSRYARLIMTQEADLSDLFETRELATERRAA
jgi:hypothetical protein